MLTPKPMVRVDVLALDRDLLAVSERVGALGVLHPTDVRELGAWAVSLEWTEMDSLASSYDSVARRLDRLAEFISLPEGDPPTETRVSPAESLRQVMELLGWVEPEVKALEDRMHDLQSELLHLEVVEGQLEMLGRVDVDLAALRDLRFLHLVAGLMPPENVRRLDESLREIPHVLIPVRRVRERVLVFVFARREDADTVDRAAQSAYVERMEIPTELSGRPEEARAQLMARRENLEREIRALEQDRASLRDRWSGEVRGARADMGINARVVDLWRQAGRTERTRLLTGWVPRADRETFMAGVVAATSGRSLLTMEEPSPADSTAPTDLANPRPFRPFQLLTRTYGLPNYWDLDPTLLAAPLFLVMFGWMFGDLGQGAVLALLGAVLAFGWVVRGYRDFGIVLAASGVSAMVFGLLYGSVFGAEGLFPALWLHPMESPIVLIGAAIAFGVAIISLGLIFGAIAAWRRRDLAAFYLGQHGLVGLWLYWGLVIAALLVLVAPDRLSILAAAVLVGAPLVLYLFHGPIARALGWTEGGADSAYAVQVGVESFDLVIRFASNTLSFLRLGAFALGHAGLGVTIFALAELLRGLPVASWATIIVGNALIIVLEALVVGIQALRLEYYEFFTKFLLGDGVAYRPFTLSSEGTASGRSRGGS